MGLVSSRFLMKLRLYQHLSALSWYFLNLFGLNGVFKLILGSENCEPSPLFPESLRR